MDTPKIIATAETVGGFAIAVLRTPTIVGGHAFEVVRMDARSRYVVLGRYVTEAGARTRANIEYRADRSAA